MIENEKTAEAAAVQTEVQPDSAPPAPKKKKRGKKKIIVPLVLLLVAGGAAAVYFLFFQGATPAAQATTTYDDYTVATQDITLELSGTGTLKPADSYTVTALVTGTVLSADFEEGDIVEKDALLYEIDNTDVLNSIEQAEISLEQSRRSYSLKAESLDDLKVYANESGTVIELNVEVGDDVSPNQTLAKIRDSSVMSIIVPFASNDAARLTIGGTAEVTLDGSFEVFSGKISDIAIVEQWNDSGVATREVTIEVKNPGGLYPGLVATATANGAGSLSSGTFAYRAESVITATTSGEVTAVNIKKGGQVSENQLAIVLKSKSLENELFNSSNSLRNSELALESKYDDLDNYLITSPISGTVIEKSVKEGDKLQSAKTLCTIYDLTYLTMTLNIDELDISKIAVGQEVTVTAEALENRYYTGVVSKVSISGTTSNGTTVYPVTIRIDETEGLLPGMNVTAKITVSQSLGVVAVPVSALSRGNVVFVKSDGTGGEQDERLAQMAERLGVPEGYELRMVTTGNSDADYIEITSGLAAGEVIAIANVTVTNSATDGQGAFFFGGGGGNLTGERRFVTSGETPSGGGTAVQMPAGGFGG